MLPNFRNLFLPFFLLQTCAKVHILSYEQPSRLQWFKWRDKRAWCTFTSSSKLAQGKFPSRMSLGKLQKIFIYLIISSSPFRLPKLLFRRVLRMQMKIGSWKLVCTSGEGDKFSLRRSSYGFYSQKNASSKWVAWSPRIFLYKQLTSWK